MLTHAIYDIAGRVLIIDILSHADRVLPLAILAYAWSHRSVVILLLDSGFVLDCGCGCCEAKHSYTQMRVISMFLRVPVGQCFSLGQNIEIAYRAQKCV